MEKQKKSTAYFKNLDGLRFLAAFAVIVAHCQAVVYHGGTRIFSPYVDKLASFGVDFFFVLSGFLISYLLIAEVENTGTIRIRRFYIRRLLRLWPLYFLVGIVGIVGGSFWQNFFNYYPENPYTTSQMFQNLGFLCSFSTNFQTLLGLNNAVSSLMVAHFWSLGIEEQFYLLWAPMLLIFRRHVIHLVITFICIGFIINELPPDWFGAYHRFQYNFTGGRFFHFALGAAVAWYFQHRTPPIIDDSLLARCLSWAVQLTMLVPMMMYLFGDEFHETHERSINGIISAAMLWIATTEHSVLHLEFGWLKYLGKISFGIYVFHLFAVRLAEKILLSQGLTLADPVLHIALPTLATVFSVILAVISYEYFEKYFLNLKTKYK